MRLCEAAFPRNRARAGSCHFHAIPRAYPATPWPWVAHNAIHGGPHKAAGPLWALRVLLGVWGRRTTHGLRPCQVEGMTISFQELAQQHPKLVHYAANGVNEHLIARRAC